MRRAELAKDCVQKNMKDASISESTLKKEDAKKCQSLHVKFAFAPGLTTARKRRNVPKRLRRENIKKLNKASECRRATKLWHKQCSALAKCCPLTEDCKVETKEIMDQIIEERRKLRSLKEECSL